MFQIILERLRSPLKTTANTIRPYSSVVAKEPTESVFRIPKKNTEGKKAPKDYHSKTSGYLVFDEQKLRKRSSWAVSTDLDRDRIVICAVSVYFPSFTTKY